MAYTLPQVFQKRKDVQDAYNKIPVSGQNAWLTNWWNTVGKNEAADMWSKDNAKESLQIPYQGEKMTSQKPVDIQQDQRSISINSSQGNVIPAPSNISFGAGQIDYSQQIRDLYQNNFGRQPSYSELSQQNQSLNNKWDTLENLNNWAKNHPQNINKQVSQPTQTSSQSAVSPIQSTPPKVDTGDDALNKLLEENRKFLDKLIQQGKQINVKVDITPETTAKFLAQAQKEISPYYESQLKLAREGLLRQAGYTTDEIVSQESELERGYGKGVRQLGEQSAETGFALSGQRQLQEKEMADEAQRTLEENRKRAEYNMGSAARQFAGEWGGSSLPTYDYASAPKVLAGQEKFQRTLSSKPFYNISDSVYQGLTGSRQYEQQTAQKQRQSELEGAWRTQEENRLRKLAL